MVGTKHALNRDADDVMALGATRGHSRSVEHADVRDDGELRPFDWREAQLECNETEQHCSISHRAKALK